MRILIIGLGGFGKNLINDIKSDLNNHIDQLLIANSDILEDGDLISKIDLNDMTVSKVEKLIEVYDQVIIASGLGGGSSKSLIPIIDIINSNKKDIEVIVNKPFSWEGDERAEFSELIIKELTDKGVSIKIFDNDEIKNYIDEDIGTSEAFKIHSGVISEYIVQKYISKD